MCTRCFPRSKPDSRYFLRLFELMHNHELAATTRHGYRPHPEKATTAARSCRSIKNEECDDERVLINSSAQEELRVADRAASCCFWISKVEGLLKLKKAHTGKNRPHWAVLESCFCVTALGLSVSPARRNLPANISLLLIRPLTRCPTALKDVVLRGSKGKSFVGQMR